MKLILPNGCDLWEMLLNDIFVEVKKQHYLSAALKMSNFQLGALI